MNEDFILCGHGNAHVPTDRTALYNSSVSTFLVLLHRSGPEWDPSLSMQEQSNWDAHASFMDRLVG